jgi:hypothetical protein
MLQGKTILGFRGPAIAASPLWNYCTVSTLFSLGSFCGSAITSEMTLERGRNST